LDSSNDFLDNSPNGDFLCDAAQESYPFAMICRCEPRQAKQIFNEIRATPIKENHAFLGQQGVKENAHVRPMYQIHLLYEIFRTVLPRVISTCLMNTVSHEFMNI
jgi:hypothetical protein